MWHCQTIISSILEVLNLLKKHGQLETGGWRAFRPGDDGDYQGRPGDRAILTRNGDDTFALREKDGTVLYFGVHLLLDSVSDRNGNTVMAVSTCFVCLGYPRVRD